MVRITFLGTRAEVEEQSEEHFYHSSLLIQVLEPDPFRLVIDYGRLHAYDLSILKPDAILITHAHPDHYIWTVQEARYAVPVFLSRETLEYGQFAPIDPHFFSPYRWFNLASLWILPYRVMHSIHCPAVGFKIQLPDQQTIIYNPDLVDIIAKAHILTDVDYYIGDGSTIHTNLVRRQGELFFGHARITTQLNWCKKHNIPNIIFTHIGKNTMTLESDFHHICPEAKLAKDEMKLIV